MAEVLVSRRAFLILLVIGMLASSGISIVVSTQLMTGPQGPQGIQGEQGIQGLQGDKGEKGEQGEPGLGVEPGFLVAPAYDSGWLNNWTVLTVLTLDLWLINLTHGLNTTEVFVYMIGRFNETTQGVPKGTIHQYCYGGLFGPTLDFAGAYWSMDENRIHITRFGSDPVWHEVRVMIWKISEPT